MNRKTVTLRFLVSEELYTPTKRLQKVLGFTEGEGITVSAVQDTKPRRTCNRMRRRSDHIDRNHNEQSPGLHLGRRYHHGTHLEFSVRLELGCRHDRRIRQQLG